MSHQRAAAASASGRFRDEIVPITVTAKRKDGSEQKITVDADGTACCAAASAVPLLSLSLSLCDCLSVCVISEGIRPGTTVELLAKLKPVFKEGGSTTAGNASQVSDGAAAVLAMRRSKADELGLPILGLRIYSFLFLLYMCSV